MTKGTRIFALALLALACVGLAPAQVSVSLKLGKRNFLAGESVPIEVTLTNLTGTELAYQSTDSSSWIDFIVNSNRCVPMTPAGKPAFGAVRIPSGRAIVRTVDLAQLYPLTELGNYSVYAIVRPPGQPRGGIQSNRHLFTINTAKPYWSEKVGVPGSRTKTREFRLIQFNNASKHQLYAQVADGNTGRILTTHHLGEVLMLRKPSVTVDSSLTMHVLYMISPKFWGHARITPDGKFLGRDLYQPSASGDPVLAKLNDGSVKALGGLYYDPKAAEEAAKRTRKASDRPDFIYE